MPRFHHYEQCQGAEFPFAAVRPGERIILYGGGIVGKTFLLEVGKTNYCEIVAICDRNPEKTGIQEVPVISISELAKMPQTDYEKIWIAIEREEWVIEIWHDLVKTGIERKRIRWIDPRRI